MALAKLSEQKTAMSQARKQDLHRLVAALARDYVVIGPVAKGKASAFEEITSPERLDLSYQTTILPPRKFLQRPRETMFFFRSDGVEETRDARPQVLFGLHPCDVHALAILDQVFTQEYEDHYYLSHRRATYIVALNCTTVGQHCFCHLLGTGPALRTGYDLLLTDLGDEYLIEVGSEAGEQLLAAVDLPPAPRVRVVEKEKRLDQVRRQLRRQADAAEWREVLAGSYYHPVWRKLADECLACGNCTMVCPTCFCFQMRDRLELNLKDGQRFREWDSCLFWEYSLVAMGHNFRAQRESRLKQRLYHKLYYYYEDQIGRPGCVGCGRCVTACPKGISPVDVVASLKGE